MSSQGNRRDYRVTESGTLIVTDLTEASSLLGELFVLSTSDATFSNNATWAFKVYASTTMYPNGIAMTFDSAADDSPMGISVSTYTTFTFSTYAASTNWRYPQRLNLTKSTTLASVTMATSTKASTPAVQIQLYRGYSGPSATQPIVLAPSVGYRVMLTNVAGATCSAAWTVGLREV